MSYVWLSCCCQLTSSEWNPSSCIVNTYLKLILQIEHELTRNTYHISLPLPMPAWLPQANLCFASEFGTLGPFISLRLQINPLRRVRIWSHKMPPTLEIISGTTSFDAQKMSSYILVVACWNSSIVDGSTTIAGRCFAAGHFNSFVLCWNHWFQEKMSCFDSHRCPVYIHLPQVK